MTINLPDKAELQSQLASQIIQGGAAGNSARYYNGLEPPKQADIATFKAVSSPAVLQQSQAGVAFSLINSMGSTKATAALPEIYNAGNSQQIDQAKNNKLPDQDVDESDSSGKQARDGEAGDQQQFLPDKAEGERKKQSEIDALIHQIRELQQRLTLIDSRNDELLTSQQFSSDGFSQHLNKFLQERMALVYEIQQLQQTLQDLEAL